MTCGSLWPCSASSSSARAPVDHWPVLVLVPPGRPIWPNRISPSCFGLPGLTWAPAMALISCSSATCSLPKSLESRASTARSMAMPRCSIRASTCGMGRSSVSYTVTTCSLAMRGFRREERLVLVLHVIEARGAAAEITGGYSIHIVRAFAGVEHVGHQHGVVDRADADAAGGEHQPFALHVVADLGDEGVFEHLFQCVERAPLRDLPFAKLGGEQARAFAVARLPVPERQIGGLIRRHRQRNTAERRLHRID